MKSIRQLYKIGPGPSSSHTMGPMYAVQNYLRKYPNADEYIVTLYGSLALTGRGHFTDKIIEQTFQPHKVTIEWNLTEVNLEHPNTMTIKGVLNENILEEVKYFSVGGGTIMVNTMKGSLFPDFYPETSMEEIINKLKSQDKTIYEYVYETEDDGFGAYMDNIFNTMLTSADEGLSSEGLLPGTLKVLRRAKAIYAAKSDPSDLRGQKVSSYAFAVSETNASMGMIVTAPTCGAAGVVPAVVNYLYRDLKIDKQKIIDGLVTAGMIGNLIKLNATVSGAEGGCQAEIGSASAMAAALIAQVYDRDLDTIAASAATALEHCLGLTCDPVGGYVIIPCIERNAIYANESFHAAYLAQIQDGSKRVPLDIVIKTMAETGKDMDAKYRETSLGGLAKNFC